MEWVYFHDLVTPYYYFFGSYYDKDWQALLEKKLKARGFSQLEFELLSKLMVGPPPDETIHRNSLALLKSIMTACQESFNSGHSKAPLKLKEDIRYYKYLFRELKARTRHKWANEIFEHFEPRAQRILISYAKEAFISDVMWNPNPKDDDPAFVIDAILSGRMLKEAEGTKKEGLKHER
jgi:hypothetical protein